MSNLSLHSRYLILYIAIIRTVIFFHLYLVTEKIDYEIILLIIISIHIDCFYLIFQMYLYYQENCLLNYHKKFYYIHKIFIFK